MRKRQYAYTAAMAGVMILFLSCTGHAPEKVTKLYQAVYDNDHATVDKLIQEKVAVDDDPAYTSELEWYDETYTGYTPLIVAVRRDYYEIAEDLIQAGADCNRAGTGGITPLMMAAGTGNVRMTKLLLDHGADTAARDEVGTQALGDAAEKGYTETVKLLLQKGADVDAPQRGGGTPLMGAVDEGKTETVKALIAAGADVKVAGNNGETALTFAVQNNALDLARILIAAGADTNTEVITDQKQALTLVTQAAALGNSDMIKLLVKHGADIKKQTDYGFFSLLLAAQYGKYEAVVTLMGLGADVNEANKRGETALIFASSQGHDDIVAYLIKHGSKIDSKTKIGDTALWSAMLDKGTVHTVAILLQAGADPNVTTEIDGDTYTPLSYAREHENTELAALLKRYGAK
jgi:ankyrin repeat protein